MSSKRISTAVLSHQVLFLAALLCGPPLARGQALLSLTPNDSATAQEFLRIPNNTPTLHNAQMQPDGSRVILKAIPAGQLAANPAIPNPIDAILHAEYCSSSSIVVALAGKSVSTLTSRKETILTRTALVVNTIIKPGDLASSSSFTIIREGGEVLDNGEKWRVGFRSSTPYQEGKMYLLFLRKKTQGGISADYFSSHDTIEVVNSKLRIDSGRLGPISGGESLADAVGEINRVVAIAACR